MTRRISTIVFTVAAVFVLAVPAALAGPEPQKRGVGDFGLSFNLIASPTSLSDASDRAKLGSPVAPLDAFERAVVAGQRDLRTGSPYLDAHQRAVLGNRSEETITFERAVAAQSRSGVSLIGDSHDRIGPASMPVSVPTVSSGREIEWPQIGIGFGVGIVLMLGLYLALRATRTRPLAH